MNPNSIAIAFVIVYIIAGVVAALTSKDRFAGLFTRR